MYKLFPSNINYDLSKLLYFLLSFQFVRVLKTKMHNSIVLEMSLYLTISYLVSKLQNYGHKNFSCLVAILKIIIAA